MATRGELLRLASALDRCTNLFGNPIAADNRARIFACVDNPTAETWQDARSSLVTPGTTLWQAAIATGMPAYDVPDAGTVILAIEMASKEVSPA